MQTANLQKQKEMEAAQGKMTQEYKEQERIRVITQDNTGII
jgi:hypothetical protein